MSVSAPALPSPSPPPDFHLTESDHAYEEELQRNPGSVKLWMSYFKSNKDSPSQHRFYLYERAVSILPRSYKLWFAYLKDRREDAKATPSSENIEGITRAYEQALTHLRRMPRLWEDYLELLIEQKKITKTRRAINKALQSLSLLQHQRIWNLAMRMIRELSPPESTGMTLFRRYLMLQPGHVETYIAYLISCNKFDAAATQLARIVSDDSFQSIEGKTNHMLWMDLCKLICEHPKEIKSVPVEAILRSGIAKFSDEVGRLWNALAERSIRLGEFDRARDVFEEALEKVSTVQDFSIVFESYQRFLETVLEMFMGDAEETAEKEQKALHEEANVDIDMFLEILQELVDRRQELLSSVLLRQNPHHVANWIKRAKLFEEDPAKVALTFTEAVKTVNPQQAVGGRVSQLWIAFAKLYVEFGDLDSARQVFEKAVKADFRHFDDLASVWCEWIELEEKEGNFKQALEVARRGVGQYRGSRGGTIQSQLFKSSKLWLAACDLEESFGSLDSARATYEGMISSKAVTPQALINYAHMEEENKFFERAFRVYEKGVNLFRWPHVKDIWLMYLSKFVSRYKGSKLERARDLFEKCLSSCPPQFAKIFFLLYAQLEEEYGLARHALKILKKSVDCVEDSEKMTMYLVLIAKTSAFLGATVTRSIYQQACESLPKDMEVVKMCIAFSNLEKALGELDRARGILVHASQYCDPTPEGPDQAKAFWAHWKSFELMHGNEDTYKEMRRIRRSVEAQHTQIHFNSADISHQLATESGEAQGGPKDAMQTVEGMELDLD